MYSTEFVPDPDQISAPPPNYAKALKDVVSTAASLAHSELQLIRAEFDQASYKLREHIFAVVAFGALLVVSVFPLLAFLILVVGEWLGHRYGLSALIVSAVCAGVGGPLALRAYRKIRNEDLSFTRSRSSLLHTTESVRRQFEKVKYSTFKEASHGSASVS